jgi:hypothetical protein
MSRSQMSELKKACLEAEENTTPLTRVLSHNNYNARRCKVTGLPFSGFTTSYTKKTYYEYKKKRFGCSLKLPDIF